MKKNVLRTMSAALALTMMVGVAGCGGNTATPTPTPTPAAPTPATGTPAPGTDPTPAANVYPLNSSTTLQYWCEMQSNYSSFVTNFGETEFAKAWQEAVGVKMNYVQPSQGGSQEAFNIMIASGDLPDVIEWNWVSGYPGGSTAAMDDKVILQLNEPMANWAPNYMAYLGTNPTLAKQVKTDSGALFCFPFVRGTDKLKTTSGMMIRKDWMDELKLELPETIDDWEALLTTLKDAKNLKAPFASQASNGADGPLTGLYNTFLPAYNVRKKAYVDGSTVKYGYAEAGYKDFVAKMADWYAKGLLDPNFLTAVDRKILDANVLTELSGAYYGPGGGGMGPWILEGQKNNPNFDLVATKFPVLTRGTLTSYGGTSHDFTEASKAMGAITTKAKDVELVTRVMDYAFSPEGHILFNFGTEGVSYNMVNGIPTYSDIIFNNPDGLSIAQAIAKYARGNMNGPFAQDEQYIIQYYTMDQQKDALDKWTQQDKPASTLMPPISLTVAESAELAALESELDTFVTESISKFITGITPMSGYDAYLAQLDKLGYKRVIEIYTDAVNRFNQR